MQRTDQNAVAKDRIVCHLNQTYTARMQVTLTPEAEALLQKQMESGRFSDASEVIATALTVLSDTMQEDYAELDALIQEGIDSADRGELYSEGEARAYIAAMRANLPSERVQALETSAR